MATSDYYAGNQRKRTLPALYDSTDLDQYPEFPAKGPSFLGSVMLSDLGLSSEGHAPWLGYTLLDHMVAEGGLRMDLGLVT